MGFVPEPFLLFRDYSRDLLARTTGNPVWGLPTLKHILYVEGNWLQLLKIIFHFHKAALFSALAAQAAAASSIEPSSLRGNITSNRLLRSCCLWADSEDR